MKTYDIIITPSDDPENPIVMTVPAPTLREAQNRAELLLLQSHPALRWRD